MEKRWPQATLKKTKRKSEYKRASDDNTSKNKKADCKKAAAGHLSEKRKRIRESTR